MRRALAQESFVPAREGRKIVGRAQGPTFAGAPAEGKRIRNEQEIRRASAKWSRAHSRVVQSRYKPEFQGRKLQRYYDAYVNPETRANRIENGLASLYTWLVEEEEYYTPEEFDTQYRGEL